MALIVTACGLQRRVKEPYACRRFKEDLRKLRLCALRVRQAQPLNLRKLPIFFVKLLSMKMPLSF